MISSETAGQAQTPFSGQQTLSAEHRLLWDEVSALASSVRLAAGAWPEQQLHQLLNYLHLELLRQLNDEEWLLFRDLAHHTEQLAVLRQQHLQLRLAVDALTAADAEPQPGDRAQLNALVAELLSRLQVHLASEEALLDAHRQAPSTAAMGAIPHAWYALIEAACIDVDELPGPQAVDAVLGRLLRLRAGERVELTAGADPLPLWRRLAMADPAGYGFRYLQQGPPRWRVEVTRRADD